MPSLKYGLTTTNSGRWQFERYGSFVKITSPGSRFSAPTSAIAVGTTWTVEPIWAGTYGACATISSLPSKTTHEKSSASLNIGE